jgi:hypothetical protein
MHTKNTTRAADDGVIIGCNICGINPNCCHRPGYRPEEDDTGVTIISDPTAYGGFGNLGRTDRPMIMTFNPRWGRFEPVTPVVPVPPRTRDVRRSTPRGRSFTLKMDPHTGQPVPDQFF